MIVRLNVALRNLLLNSLFNTGLGAAMFDGGTVYFRSGATPAAADNAATGTVIATIALPADAMAAAAGGSISKNVASWQDLSADATGVMGYARFVSADATLVMDMDVTDNAGNGAIKVDNPAVVAAQQFFITAFTLTMPAST